MTNVNDKSEFKIFVTHVDADGPKLKIFGQVDQDTSLRIEKLMKALHQPFAMGVGKPPQQSRLDKHLVCAGMFDNEWYRAKICRSLVDGSYAVRFIDYGNTEILDPEKIRVFDGILEAPELIHTPPQSIEFSLAGVLPSHIHGIWDGETTDIVRQHLGYREFSAKTCYMAADIQLIDLDIVDHEPINFLMSKNFAFPATVEEILRAHMNSQKHQTVQRQAVVQQFRESHSRKQEMLHTEQIQQQQQQQAQHQQLYMHPRRPIMHAHENNAPMTSRYPQSRPPPLLQSSSYAANPEVDSRRPHIPSHSGLSLRQPKSPIQLESSIEQDGNASAFKSQTVEIDAKHQVTVSYIENGPSSFYVQLQSTSDRLSSMMRSINNHTPQRLLKPPSIGTVCLGRNAIDKVLLRAVIGKITEKYCSLYYVDYGNTENVPFTDIYQIPSKYILPPTMAIRFTLYRVSEIKIITEEMKKCFVDLVRGKTLLLHIKPNDLGPVNNHGDLYDNGRNILDLLRTLEPKEITSWQGCWKLLPGAQEIVLVTYVESCNKLYVQLDREVPLLDNLMSYIANYAENAKPIKPNQLRKHLQCIALSAISDQWSRAEVLAVGKDGITVFFVDYGNEEILRLEALRCVDSKVTQLRAQAIRCILKGFEDPTMSTPELDNSLEVAILEHRVPMVVKIVIPAGLIVELYDSTVDPLQNILTKLQRAANNGNIPTDNRNDTSQNTGKISARRYNSRKQSTSGQQQKTKSKHVETTRDEQGNKLNTTRDSPKIQDPNPQSLPSTRSNNSKDEDNEQRRQDNRYQNRGNDRERTIGIAASGGQQNERFSRDDGRNDRFPRDGQRQERDNDRTNRYDRSDESNVNIRGGAKGGRNDRGYGNGRFSGNNSRTESNGNQDKSWSDKDSDTSSRGSGKHGRRDNGGRGGNNRRETAPPRNQNNRDNNSDNDKSFKTRSNGSSRNRDVKRDFTDKTEVKQIDSDDKKSTPSSQIVRIAQPNITVGAIKHCEISFINSPTDFYVQLRPDNSELSAVTAHIEENYQNGGKLIARSMIKPGTNCVAQCSLDDQWYRATVQTVEADAASVYYVDYGNTENLPFNKIKEIDAFSSKLAAQAIACKLLAASKTTWEPSEIAKFEELANCVNLEAEFVALEDNFYDVILKTVVDGVTQTNSINEEFSAGADINQAKNSARNKRRPIARSAITESTDYAPIDFKWNVATNEPGSKNNVSVTWFINPDNFFCQSLTQKDEFETMMNDVQKLYEKRTPIDEPLQVGSAVIAVFSEDGAKYRAEIIELNKARGNIVRYIDFGNSAMVEQRNIYRVEKKLTKMPKQAIACSLKNVVPTNGSNWSKANQQEIEKFFSSEKYECTFHEMKDNKYITSLSNGGVDVAGQLVDKSLAAFAVSGPVASDAKAATAVATVETPNQPQVEESPRFDISLLAGQVLRVKVSNVTSIAKFHVQLPSANVSDSIIDTYMAEKNPKVMPRLSSREVCLGAGCLVNTDEGWRRAVVVNCSCTTGFRVRFIDTGANDEIPLDCMLALPGELAVMQNQAVECCIKNSNPDLKSDEEFRKLIENKDVIIVVEEVDNNRLIVDLYDTEGNKIKLSPAESDASICPVCPMPILSSTHEVTVIHAEHSGSVWLKRTSDAETDCALLGELFDHYETSPKLTDSLLPGALCAAKSADENWYRAKILNASDSAVTVLFLDYGNTEDINPELIRSLEPKFHIQSQLAVEVALTVTLGGSKDQQQEILNAHTEGKEFTATIYNVRKNWVAELTDDEGKISEKLSALNAIEVSQNRDVQAEEVPEMIVGGRYNVICSHIDNPAQFWLQRDEETPLIEQLLEKLQIDAPNYSALEGISEIGTLCIAMYSVDEQWYRAEVLDADEDITTIRFIDYGNTDIIDTNSGKIKEIPDSLKTIKRYATKCRLDVMPVDSDDWSPEACEYFEQLAISAPTVEALVIADGNPRRVELFVDAESVVEALVKQNYAAKIDTEEDLQDERVEREIDPRAAYVSHVISPSEFWVQTEQFVAQLETLADRFMVAEMFTKIDDIKEGLLCAAKFPEDGKWYRARVVSHAESGAEVIYIDWGNSAISTEIRNIPEDLATLPQLSKKCCLALPKGVERWSVEAETEFVKLASEGKTVFLLDVIEDSEEISTVVLTVDGQDVVERLVELCERPVPIIEERLPPLGEENSPNVVVSNVNSPSEFWTQAESRMAELDAMNLHLTAAESFLPIENIEEGIICAAQFPEDGLWYRAKVLSHGDKGTDVIYIDWGNTAVATELRRLPEDIVNIPALSMCCSLNMPESIEAWSEEACEKFFELVDSGVTMFQYEILEQKEQTLIKLTLEGKDIVETLSSMCKNKIEQQSKDSVQDKKIITTEEKIIEDNTYSSSTSGIEVTMNSATISGSSAKLESTEGSSVNYSEAETISQIKVSVPIENIPPKIEVAENAQIVNHNASELSLQESISSIVELSDANEFRHEMSVPENGSFGIESSTPEVSVLETIQQLNRPKTPVDEKILPGTVSRGLSEEEIIINQVERSNVVPRDEKILPGSVNKGDAVEAVEETAETKDIKSTEQAAEIRGIDAISKPETAQEAAISSEPEAPQDSKTSNEPEASRDVKTLDEPEVQRDLEASAEQETDVETEVSDKSEMAPIETEASDKPETAPVVTEASDKPETEPIETEASDKPEMAPIETEVSDKPEAAYEETKETESLSASKISEDETEGSESLSSVQTKKIPKEDKILPGILSRSESPLEDFQTTPKTSHADKLVAGVVNLQEKLTELEADETVSLVVDDNIPKKSITRD